MKKKDLIELKGKELKDLKKMVLSKKDEAGKAQVKKFGGEGKNLKIHKNLRIEIAKIMTIIREKEIIEKLKNKQSLK